MALRVRDGDRAAREALILANLPLAIRYASYFRAGGMTHDDLVQEGFCGLIRAVETFDPQAHGTRFSTYAVYWIIQTIQAAVARDASLIRVPYYLFRLGRELDRLKGRQRERKSDGTETEMTSPDELAVALGISPKRLGLLYRSRLKRRHSDDECPGGGDSETLEEQVVDPFSPLEELERAEEIQLLYRAIEALPEVEAWVIRRRFRMPERPGTMPPGADVGVDLPRDLRSLAALLGVSTERIQKLEHSALWRLRSMLDGETAHHQAAG